jgi:PadR family transcriptional regulator, regulatory protein PadR
LTEPIAILRGTLDTLVLRALLGGAMHGYQLSEWFDRRARQDLSVLDSAIYQSLYRLERQQLIAAEWGLSVNNRQARYYRLTSKGRASLRAETATWLRYTAAVTALLTEPEPAR